MADAIELFQRLLDGAKTGVKERVGKDSFLADIDLMLQGLETTQQTSFPSGAAGIDFQERSAESLGFTRDQLGEVMDAARERFFAKEPKFPNDNFFLDLQDKQFAEQRRVQGRKDFLEDLSSLDIDPAELLNSIAGGTESNFGLNFELDNLKRKFGSVGDEVVKLFTPKEDK